MGIDAFPDSALDMGILFSDESDDDIEVMEVAGHIANGDEPTIAMFIGGVAAKPDSKSAFPAIEFGEDWELSFWGHKLGYFLSLLGRSRVHPKKTITRRKRKSDKGHIRQARKGRVISSGV
jgi:hypothetical protein